MKLESIEEIPCFETIAEDAYMLPLFVTSLGSLLYLYQVHHKSCMVSNTIWFDCVKTFFKSHITLSRDTKMSSQTHMNLVQDSHARRLLYESWNIVID